MAAAKRYCDLVMKGGITSGLVYPNALVELARTYRFKSIGGTSAGAIAAAAAAAAALGERRKQIGEALDPAAADAAGMTGLEAVADRLAGEGFIYSLFQPAPANRAAFRLAVKLAAGPGPARALGEGLLATARLGWRGALLALLGFLAIGWLAGGRGGLLAAAPPALLCAAAVGAWRAAVRAAGAVAASFLGFCPGMGQPGGTGPALTEWMHHTIRALAGRSDAAGAPVTFGELWRAPAYPDEPASEQTIRLQMITTNLSHLEPRTLPFTAGGLYFREDEFARLFPQSIIAWLKHEAPSCRAVDGHEYHELPVGDRLPIVVAARMSLSFPMLVSAVPLYERDFSAEGPANPAAPTEPKAESGERTRLAATTDALAAAADEAPGPAETPRPGGRSRGIAMRRCWFSDGGISSNFPIHLFDAPMPRWPTFAIDLVDAAKGEEAAETFLPENNNQGLRPRYAAIDRGGGVGTVLAFARAIIATMQNWRDLLQGRAPGHRDRIVRVGLAAEEGGANLDMPKARLSAIAEKGRRAGALIVEKFDFDNHFWVRYRNAASAIERFAISFGDGLAPPISPDNRRAYDRMWDPTLWDEGPYRFSRAQADEAVSRLNSIRHSAAAWKDCVDDLTRGAPKPLPELRITPTY